MPGQGGHRLNGPDTKEDALSGRLRNIIGRVVASEWCGSVRLAPARGILSPMLDAVHSAWIQGLQTEALMHEGEQVSILVAAVRRPAWMRDARCREPDAALADFFPSPGQSTSKARALGSTCLVRVECGEYATAGPEQGIWGGRYRPGTSQRRAAGLADRVTAGLFGAPSSAHEPQARADGEDASCDADEPQDSNQRAACAHGPTLPIGRCGSNCNRHGAGPVAVARPRDPVDVGRERTGQRGVRRALGFLWAKCVPSGPATQVRPGNIGCGGESACTPDSVVDGHPSRSTVTRRLLRSTRELDGPPAPCLTLLQVGFT